MNRKQLVITLLSELEDIAQELYDEHGFSHPKYDKPVTVEMYGDNQDRTVPAILLNDQESHDTQSIGNNNKDGVATDDAGNVIGERYRYKVSCHPKIQIRVADQMDSYDMVREVVNRFRQYVGSEFLLVDNAPPALNLAPNEDHIHSLSPPKSRTQEVAHGSANDVYQEMVDFDIEYSEIVVDPTPEAIDTITSRYDSDGDGDWDEEIEVSDSGTTYI